MGFERNLLTLREKKNLSAIELADKIGASKQQVYAWEKGDYKPSKKFLPKLCEVLGVSVSDLYSENLTPEPKLEQGNNYDLSHMNTAIQSLLMTIDSMKQDIKRLEREVEQLKLAGKRNE